MDADQYRAWSAPFRGEPACRALQISNTALTGLFYVLYPVLLILLAWSGTPLFFPCLFTPVISFLALSFFRKHTNAPRPYETLDIEPLIKKNVRGKSFPSRHVFSAFLITMCWFAYLPTAGIILLVPAALVVVIRVIGGVHFPKDVVVGAVVGIACGLLGLPIL